MINIDLRTKSNDCFGWHLDTNTQLSRHPSCIRARHHPGRPTWALNQSKSVRPLLAHRYPALLPLRTGWMKKGKGGVWWTGDTLWNAAPECRDRQHGGETGSVRRPTPLVGLAARLGKKSCYRRHVPASSVMPCAEILAHDEDRNFGAWWRDQKFQRITTRRYLD